jgi:hypothetical protein
MELVVSDWYQSADQTRRVRTYPLAATPVTRSD